MLAVDVISLQDIEPLKMKTTCQFAWDDRIKRIFILKGKRVSKQILKDRYLNKRYAPKKLKYIEAKQGK